MTAALETADLLIEFLTEELPPENLEAVGHCFANSICEQLMPFIYTNSKLDPQKKGTANNPKLEVFTTPRRFGVLIKSVNFTEPTKIIEKKGPAIKVALTDGTPTSALIGFTKSCGLHDWRELTQNDDGYFYAKQNIKGRTLDQVLVEVITSTLKKLPIAKHMRWGNNDFSFVRPVHNLLIKFGHIKLSLPTPILGLDVVDYTYGHRVMSAGKIKITSSNSYKEQMMEAGKVIADFTERRNKIKEELKQALDSLNLHLDPKSSPQLLNFVTGIIEYPVVLSGEFNTNFLEIPKECLISSMVKHQKYFALFNNDTNQLSNKFLFVANIDSKNPKVIIAGNEKVLSARLSDAQFFYNTDKKYSLEEHLEKLKHVVYHNKLGSQYQRVLRLQFIANKMAPLFNVDQDSASSAAYLAKADLTTEMVGEFPELQGIMGKYYAKNQGLSDEIANAIEKHYYPRFSSDSLPNDILSIIISLADKLETLVGIWNIGLIPTGEKDPFALRRAALGVIRILLGMDISYTINIKNLLQIVATAFTDDSQNYNVKANILEDVYQFLLQRLVNFLISTENGNLINDTSTEACVNNGYSINMSQSICKTNPEYFSHIPTLITKLSKFATNNKNQELFIANKRIENILKKDKGEHYEHMDACANKDIKADLLIEDAEKVLYTVWQNNVNQLTTSASQNNWDKYFKTLEEFNHPISQFFACVMVMADDLAIRNNRVCLLQNIYNTLNKYCILSELSL